MQDIENALSTEIHELIVSEISRRYETFTLKIGSFEQMFARIETRLISLEKILVQRKKSSATRSKVRMKGADIVIIRHRLNLSQAAFARLLAVDRACLNRWEHGQVVPRQRSLMKIAEFRMMGKKELAERLRKVEEEIWK